MNALHVLYRFYNTDGELLYIGMTGDPSSRFKAHRIDKDWWFEVDTIKVENHSSRADLADAERAAILSECPRHNVVYNMNYSLEEYDDFVDPRTPEEIVEDERAAKAIGDLLAGCGNRRAS